MLSKSEGPALRARGQKSTSELIIHNCVPRIIRYSNFLSFFPGYHKNELQSALKRTKDPYSYLIPRDIKNFETILFIDIIGGLHRGIG